jgi:ubiquitin carboxyl-terminal hydrolase 34
MATDFAVELKALGNALSDFNIKKEPLTELAKLELWVRQLRDNPESIPEDQRGMILNALPSFVNSILVCKNFTEAGAESAGEILSHVMLMLPKHYTNNKYLEALRLVGDPEKPFYKLIAQDDRPGSWTIPPEPAEDPFSEWRKTLKPGDWIDAVMVDPEYDRKCWARAQITEMIMDDRIQIEFEDQSSAFDRRLSIYSQEIAPFRTYSTDDGWRDQLDVSSFVDAFDTASTWYNCTVLEKRIVTNDKGKPATEVKIAYRIYEADGEKFDEIGNFRGWSGKYDEYINIRSPRLAPFNLVARKWPIPTPQYLEENVIDDSNDLIIRESYAFAVTRPDKFKSYFMVRNLNRFGKAGGFEWILEKFDINKEICTFEVFFSLISFVGRSYGYYHKRFAMEYVPKLKQLFISYFLDSPQTLIREFNKEKIAIMSNIMEFVLKRLHTIPEKAAIIEDLHLKLSLKCFESPYLEKRIQGLKGILESIKSFRYPNWQHNASNALVDWILRNNIIQGIFGTKGHHQLIQRSSEILRLLSNENALTEEHLEMIWSATERSDDESKMSVYKVVGEASSVMKPENLDFMVRKISYIPANKLIKQELELIHELTKYPLRAGIATTRACDFLWKVAVSQEDYLDEVKDLSLENFCNLMKSWDLRKNRLNVMIQCVEKIRENISTVQCLKIIKKLLVNFANQATTTDPLTRDSVIEILIKQHEILTAFFDNLHYFKQIAAQIVAKLANPETLADMLVVDRTTYKENIEERLNFLHTFLSTSTHFTLTQRQMDALWDSLLKNALCSAERDCFMKWLSEVTESQSQGKKIFDDSDVFEFFRQKVGNPSNDYHGLTSEGFKVFKSYFLLVNVSLQKLLQFPKHYFYSSSSGAYSTYPSTGNNYSTENQPKEFEYSIIVPPYELEGMECLRKLLFEVQADKVLDQAFEFFIMLYDCSNIRQIEDLIEIRKEYIEYLLTHLRDSTDISYKLRALYLLRNFMEECEKQGTAGLKPHGAMLKGDLHNIIVLNQVSYYPNKPEIPKKLEFKLHSNTTFWELRSLVGKKVKLLPDEFRLTRSFPHKDIKDSENGKTLNDLRIRPTETLVVYKKSSNIPRANLLDSEQTLLTQPKAIFTSMFYKFADSEGRMSAEGCAAFTNSCTGDQCKASDRRIQDFFTNYDDDNDGYLTLDNFLEFYRQACINRISTVWSNIYAYHYNNELRSYLDIDNERTDVRTIPGYIITQSKKHFDLLFEILNIPELANEAWNLVVKLPTNSEIYNKLLRLEDDWESLFDPTSKHRLLYSLQIIESFMEDVHEENPEIMETHREWKRNFLVKGGFQSLYRILLAIRDAQTTFDKNCLGFVLKLLSVFILAAFSASRPDIYEVVELVRQSSGGVESPAEPTSEQSPTQPNEKKIQFNEGDTQPTDSAAGYNDYVVQGPITADQHMMIEQFAATKIEEDSQAASKYTESKVFKDLVNQVMLYNLSDEIINSIDFKQLITRLIELIGGTLQDTEYENEDRHIIDSALELWVSCLLHKNELIEAVYNIQHGMPVEEFTMRGITYPKTILVRKAFGQSLNQICQKVEYPAQMPRPFFLRLLLKNMPKGPQNSKETEWAQFFELLSTLVENDVSDPSIDYKELTSELLNQILEHPFTEKRNAYYSDKILVGLMILAEKIFSNIPELKDMAYEQNFTKNAFFSLLFSQSKNVENLKYHAETAQDQGHFEPPKCKARDTRAAAYKLVSTLVRGHSGNLSEILEGLMSIREKIKPVSAWNYSPSSDMRSVHGYAGIVNLGCICYMNSMLQQFYMIPQFRYSILEVDDRKEPTNSAYLRGEEVDKSVPGYEIDDNMLHQFQRLYGFLELTDRQAYNPRPFTFAFKDHSGRPTNISIQSDAQEFLQMLFDRLERATKETSHKYLVQSIFGGKNISQLICTECKAIKENVEDFYNISLDVKHSKNIYESLQRYITGDMIEGYHCEGCNKPVNVNKRTLIGQLPNILICHLQRIIFNFDTYANEKINSRLEFPHTLNLEPYTKEGLERKEKQDDSMQIDVDPEDYEYELSGVVVHTGTAEAGHYYSYIRIDKEKWLEFNDTTVRSYK